jgi:hypothetical protein
VDYRGEGLGECNNNVKISWAERKEKKRVNKLGGWGRKTGGVSLSNKDNEERGGGGE